MHYTLLDDAVHTKNVQLLRDIITIPFSFPWGFLVYFLDTFWRLSFLQYQLQLPHKQSSCIFQVTSFWWWSLGWTHLDVVLDAWSWCSGSTMWIRSVGNFWLTVKFNKGKHLRWLCHIPEFDQVQTRPWTTSVHLGSLGLLELPLIPQLQSHLGSLGSFGPFGHSD